MGSETRYRAFISYSHADQAWGRRLHRQLETYRVPRHLVGLATDAGSVPKTLTPIFRDRDELSAGEDLSASVRDALSCTETLIVVCSPNAAQSRWVNEEILLFREVNPNGKILTAIIDGDALASIQGGDSSRECFPPALIGEGDQRLEPLAADLRSSGDGPRIGLLKLVAGMLDIRLDLIIRRDLQRRQRRVTAVTVASLALTLMMTGLTLFALSAQSEAERRKAQAEDLIEFMLSDLHDKLEPVGRLDVLDAVGEKIIEYYAARPTWQMESDELGRRAQAFHLLGEIADAEGNLDAAQAHFQGAYEATERLLEIAPNSVDRIFEHSQSAYWVGYFAWAQRNIDDAETYWIEYRDLIGRLRRMEPENAEYLAEAAYAYTNLGVVYLHSARLDEAFDSFSASLEIKLSIARQADDTDQNPAWVRAWTSVANTHAWMASVAERDGAWDAAIAARRAQVAVFEDELTGASDNWVVRDYALAAEVGLARTLVANTDAVTDEQIEFALALFASTAAEARLFLAQDPSNVDWRINAIGQRIWAVQAHLLDNDLASARDALREANRYLTHPALLDTDDTDVQIRRWQASLMEARILVAAGEMDAARTNLDHLAASLMADDHWAQFGADAWYLLAAAANTRADIEIADGSELAASETLSAMLEMLAPYEDRLGAAARFEYRRAADRVELSPVQAE
jgi:tetratricopeptide (TPR) repeat protein